MTKFFLASFLALSILALPSCHNKQEDTTPNSQHDMAPYASFQSHLMIGYLLMAPNGEILRQGHGCGAVISVRNGRVYAVTAGHVADNDLPIDDRGTWRLAVKFRGGRDWITRGVRVEETLYDDIDAAVISFPAILGRNFRTIRLSRRVPRVGDLVWGAGSPFRHFRYVSHRVVAGECGRDARCTLCGDERGNRCFTLDGPQWPGNSGGPVFNQRGEFVGITVSLHTFRGDPASAIILSIETIRPLIRRWQ